MNAIKKWADDMSKNRPDEFNSLDEYMKDHTSDVKEQLMNKVQNGSIEARKEALSERKGL